MKQKRITSMIVAFVVVCALIFNIVPKEVMAAQDPKLNKKNVTINITDIVMKKGQSRTLKISGTKKKVTWKSSKPSVVKVNSKGKMSAKKSGTATITGTVKQNKKQSARKYTCKVRVSAAKKKDKKVLVAYFSQTGTTKAVAEKIHKLTGGDILRIREKDKYPNDYDKTVAKAKRELNKNARPKITSVVANMKDYDIIYIGASDIIRTS